MNFDSSRDDDDEEIENEEWAAGLRYTLVEEAEVSKQLRTLQRVTQQFHDQHEHTHREGGNDGTDGSSTKGGDDSTKHDSIMMDDAEEFVQHTIANVQEFAGIGASKKVDPYEAKAAEPGKVTEVNVEIIDTVTGEKKEAHHNEEQLKKLQEEYLKRKEEAGGADGAGAGAATPEMVMPDGSGLTWEDFEKHHMPKAKSYTFPFTNTNGVGSLWIDDRKQLAKLEPYEQWDVTARVGETLNVRDLNDDSIVLQEWTVVKGQRQVVYSVP